MEGVNSANIIMYLLLFGALALGWWLGRQNRTRGGRKFKGRNPRRLPSSDYFVGLNYLLNDEPDDAVDIFIEALEVNSGTLETHMALGTLLRRRGKVDRSIAVYQDLLGRGSFSRDELNDIKIHLVQSYISAGLLDRAEHLLEELRREKGDIKMQALVLSANVYQLEKDWQMGVDVLVELLRVCPPSRRSKYQNLASHFYCEQAGVELASDHMGNAREYLKQAVAMDRNNARVSILSGQLEARCGNYNEAIKNYSRVKKQDPSFMVEVFQPLVECYKQAGKERGLQKFIDTCMREETNTTVLLGLAGYLESEVGEGAGKTYLLEKLNRKSSLRLLLHTLELEQSEEGATDREKTLIRKVLSEYINSKAQYQCVDCGFELKGLHWHCPSCSRWGTVRHVLGILGE